MRRPTIYRPPLATMSRRSPWVVGTAPQRGARALRPTAPPNTTALQKLARANKRHLVGRPLVIAMRAQASAVAGDSGIMNRLGLPALAAGMAMLISGIAVDLPGLWLTGGATTLISAGLLAHHRMRRGRLVSAFLVSEADAQALDRYLDQVATRLPQGALDRLSRIKECLARLLPLLTDERQAIDVPLEERFFAQQLVSRYLPDSCRHYVAWLETAGNTMQVDADKTAEQSLCEQIDLLQVRLDRVLAAVTASQAEHLTNHGAFLRGK